MTSPSKYVFTDIHGQAKQLETILKKINLQSDDELIFLGDYIDRGPNSKEVIDLLLEIQSKYKSTFLIGNHEQMLLSYLEGIDNPLRNSFLKNGGKATLDSYRDEQNNLKIPINHVNFFYSLETTHQDNDFFYVHAGVPNLPLYEIANEDKYKNDFLWIRSPFLFSDFIWEKKIIHGHTPMKTVDLQRNRIGLDTGACFGNVLSCLDLTNNVIITEENNEELSSEMKHHLREKNFYSVFSVEIGSALKEASAGMEVGNIRNYSAYHIEISYNREQASFLQENETFDIAVLDKENKEHCLTMKKIKNNPLEMKAILKTY